MHSIVSQNAISISIAEQEGLTAAEAPIGDLEQGDLFTLRLDRSMLEIERVSFPDLSASDFEMLFAADKVFFANLPGTRSVKELRADRQDLVLVGKDAASALARHQVDRLTLRVASVAPRTFEILRRADPSLPDEDSCSLLETFGSSSDTDSNSLFTLLPGWRKVLSDLANANFSPDNAFSLHEMACAMDLCQPLDRLISLALLPDFVPYPHQVEVVKAVLGRFRGRAMLCDEVGLGKTIEAGLALLEYIQRGLARRILILAPPSLTGQWQEELRRKFALDFVLQDEQRFEGWGAHDRIIGSLATARLSRHAGELSELEFDLIIVDEAHHLRNRNTKTWQLVNSLKKRYILLLTATPMQNGLSDLYSLVTLLRPGYLKSFSDFRKSFVSAKNPTEPRNTQQLRRLLQEVMTRNKRSHTNLILSRRHARTIEVELDGDELDFYRRVTHLVRRGLFRQAPGGKSLIDAFTLQLLQLEAGSSVPAALPTLKKIACRDLPRAYLDELARVIELGSSLSGGYAMKSRKADAVLGILESYDGKLIVFTRFRETQDFLRSYLERRGIETAVFHGGLRRLEKEAEVERFRQSPSCRVLLSSESGGEGRNLQFCRALVNYDLPWNPMRIEQRIGRIHRLGQEHDVHIFNLSASGTAEAQVLSLLDKKINLFELVVGEVDMILGNLESEKDFEETLFEIWADSEDESQVAQRLEEFGRRLHQAKALYMSNRELDERVFGDALATL